jgi:hypothetical protein
VDHTFVGLTDSMGIVVPLHGMSNQEIDQRLELPVPPSLLSFSPANDNISPLPGINYSFIPSGDCLPLPPSVVSLVFNPTELCAMRSIARHTLAFRRVFTLVFLFASSSNGTVSHVCANEALKCCDIFCTSDQFVGWNKQLSLPALGVLVFDVDDCHSHPVIGGFVPLFQAFIDKCAKAENVAALPLFISAFLAPAQSSTSLSLTYSYSKSVPPSSVEIYVLNATLLI